jgi:hypothetical protein
MSVNVKVEIRLQLKPHFVAGSCLTLSREIGPQIRETEKLLGFPPTVTAVSALDRSFSVSLGKWKSFLPHPHIRVRAASACSGGGNPLQSRNWFLPSERENFSERDENPRAHRGRAKMHLSEVD